MAGDGCTVSLGPFKSALFQLFDIHGKPVTVPLQEPDLVEPLAQEYKHVTTQWVKAQFILDKPGKRMDPETHVCRFAIEKVPAGMGKRQHELLGQGLEKTGFEGAIEVN